MTPLPARRTATAIGLALALSMIYHPSPAQMLAQAENTARAQPSTTDEQTLVERAKTAITAVKTDPNFTNFHELLGRAKAVIVVPQLLKAGFIIGGEGGSGVLLARNAQGHWSSPAFYRLGSASIGLQAGAEMSEVVLLVMNQGALDKLLKDRVTLGGDVSVAAGPIGGTVEARTTVNAGADIYSFARSKGLFGGVALTGGVLVPNEDANHAYYGIDATAQGIAIDQKYSNPAADQLRDSLPG